MIHWWRLKSDTEKELICGISYRQLEESMSMVRQVGLSLTYNCILEQQYAIAKGWA